MPDWIVYLLVFAAGILVGKWMDYKDRKPKP